MGKSEKDSRKERAAIGNGQIWISRQAHAALFEAKERNRRFMKSEVEEAIAKHLNFDSVQEMEAAYRYKVVDNKMVRDMTEEEKKAVDDEANR